MNKSLEILKVIFLGLIVVLLIINIFIQGNDSFRYKASSITFRYKTSPIQSLIMITDQEKGIVKLYYGIKDVPGLVYHFNSIIDTSSN